MNLPLISDLEQSSVLNTKNSSIDNNSSTDTAQKIQKIKTSLFKQERERLSKIFQQIRQANNQEQFLKNAVTIIRQTLAVDRVLIYRCEDNSSGRVVAESLVSGWTPTQDETIPCACFGAIHKNDYHSQEFIAIEDINKNRLTPHQKQLLESFQVQASLAVPILLESYSLEDNGYGLNKVWGLIVVQQCSQPRQWQEEEINLLYQLSVELTRILQPPLPRLHSRKQQNFMTVINREMQQLMKGMLHEIRQSIQADRVWIYSFNPDGSGEVLDESVDSQWKKAASSFDNDCFLTAENCQSQYVVNDIYAQDLAPCLIEALEAQEAKAYIAIPVLHNQKLSGVLAAFQNSEPRNWQDSEVELMVNYASKFSLPLQQTSFIRTSKFQAKQLQKQAEQEKASNRIIERIRKTLDIDEIFTVATQEIRQVLKADRTVVYQFNEDWSGQVVAESVASGWVSLLVEQTNDEVLSGDRTQNNRCILRKWAVDDITDTDTYMEKTKGGKYMKGEKFTAVDDIYTQKFPDCYIASLEKYQARAYIIAPIFQGEKLWGLLGVYQNSGTRAWQESETEQMIQIANQLAIALQQADYVEKLKQKAEEQVTVAEQAQATTTIINKIRESQDVNTIFKVTTKEVRKALKTDRTVVYQFNEDWSGQVIAESVDSGWVS
ncbi:MAG: GAF domain-containing protein, partial [Xenococcaceae cyanobacterium]